MKIITIAIIGDLCSGKKTAAEYLIKNNNYKLLKTDYSSIKLDYQELENLTISEQSSTIDIEKFESKPEKLKEKIKKLKEYKIVIYPHISWEDYEDLRNKTSLRIIHIYATPKKRFLNYLTKNPNGNFEDFLENDALISSNISYQKLKQKAFCHINNEGNLEEFEAKIASLESVFIKNFRPRWEDYFMSVAHILADRSNCIKQKVGAVLVIDNRIISTGYNGTPKGLPNCFDGGCDRCTDLTISQGSALDTCYCLHAEENSVLEAGRVNCLGATLYSSVYPCFLCAKIIVECRVKRIVYDKEYNSIKSSKLFELANIEVVKWKPDLEKFI